MFKKWPKVDTCFSFNIPTIKDFLHFLTLIRPIFCTNEISSHFLKTTLANIEANVQKSLKGGSVKADFLHGENIDHAEKKSSK